MDKKQKSEILKKIIIGALAVIIVGTTPVSLASCGEKDSTESSYSSSNNVSKGKKVNKIAIPISKKEALKLDHEELNDKLEEAGFTDVDYDGLEDLKSSKNKKNGIVSDITINGKNKFKKGQKIDADSEIFIDYHSVKSAYPPVDNYDIDEEEMDYEDVVTQYEKEGFTNIKTKKYTDNSKPKDTVKKISIDGETDYFISCPIDAKVVITYYTKAPKKTSQKASSKKTSKGNINFKKLMDDYEKFIDDYVAFMKKYQNSNDTVGMLSDYSKWMSEYAEWVDKIDDLDEDSLSSSDLAYYTKVMARVTKKLSEVK